MPQCLCWTDWEMHHTCELQQRSPGDACQRDKRVEQDVMGNACIIWCSPCIYKVPLDFLYIAILVQIKNVNRPPFSPYASQVECQTYLVFRRQLRPRWRLRRPHAHLRGGRRRRRWGSLGLTLPPALRLVGQAAETAVTAESRAETVTWWCFRESLRLSVRLTLKVTLQITRRARVVRMAFGISA